jgi:hypothetical protein
MRNDAEIKNKVEQLSLCLDRDIDNMQKTLLRLDEMRSAVIKRNDAGLVRLLDEIRCEMQAYETQQSQRSGIREELAGMLGCSCEEMTLTNLQKWLPEGQGRELAEKKERLKILAGRLKKEYSATVFLLAECARFNRLMLNGIFNKQKPDVITYNAAGVANEERKPAFVNMKL